MVSEKGSPTTLQTPAREGQRRETATHACLNGDEVATHAEHRDAGHLARSGHGGLGGTARLNDDRGQAELAVGVGYPLGLRKTLTITPGSSAMEHVHRSDRPACPGTV